MFSSSYCPVLEDYLAFIAYYLLQLEKTEDFHLISVQINSNLSPGFSPDFHLTIRKTCFHINKRKCRKLYYFRRKRTINDADVLKFHLDNLDFQNNQSRNNFYSLNIFQCLRMNETKPSSGGHYRSKETVLVICFVRQCNYLDLDGD